MTPADTQILALSCATAGLLLIVFGFHRRARAGAARALPLRTAAEAEPGTLGFYEGLASSPESMNFDAGVDAVFFRRVTEERVTSYTRRGQRARWEVVSREDKGGFFLKDASGEVFVIPAGGDLTLEKSLSGGDSGFAEPIGARRWTAQVLQPGRLACAAGTARTIQEALAFLTQHSGAGLPPGLITLLQERARSGPMTPCLFADGGPFWVADRTRDEVIAGLEGDSTLFMSCGGAAVGLAALLLASARF